MSDPVEDGVRLLRNFGHMFLSGATNDEMRVIVRNIIAPAVEATGPDSAERWVIHGHRYVAESDYERDVAAAVQAERERIRTGYAALWVRTSGEFGNADVLALIDGGSDD